MGFFKEETFVVNMPVDKAQQVFEKITGEFGKLVRDSYDKHPFTGTIKTGAFSITPNRAGMATKLAGTFEAEGMGKTRVKVKGQFVIGRLIVTSFFSIVFIPFFYLIFGQLFQETPLAASLIGLIIALIYVMVLIAFLKFPKSSFNFYTLELMRKLDKHDLIL